ncbi:MAG: AGE family epimerase/isomerase [Roseateles asaccharophilus]|uniref:Mannose/cellobiose epimerase-like protein (N-acyl-D-glucosamine 2-epimerase family) n=1 Tax=Roseateles asaccharophilus TaxID=582607 RepID=A0A4R6MZH7_9BURK|nr:AGE family epimerase/isomerase [Roseateles asaccharophilus]MDN3545399.1 AGE family epimerase/isomerase [Roseateles asaccharophilus]TDP07779.1 mannose/cellobiose epimerase-like protein (N-acyl-D-glucosamine 2-epimerase family) [Roseateles asaccharophilus]
MPVPPQPDFRQPVALLAHVRHTLDFYDPRCVDASGGFFHFYRDDGQVYDRRQRHLVSSTRFIFNQAMAWREFGERRHQDAMRHGLEFLRGAHRNPQTGGYAWLLDWHEGQARVLDGSNHAYGLAFVMLAYAHALMAGELHARAWIDETWALMEQRFWEPAARLYADEASADWRELSPYRGQNANMHACEALLAAYEATGEQRYLHRAETLARAITQRQAALAGGLIWEHYRPDWSVDWDYNREDKSNIFRPWGYQPGHLTEWAKLLLIMERHAAHLAGPSDWLLPRAIELFDAALQRSWDAEHGGMVYGFGLQGEVCDSDKYFWVQAESLAAAGLLALRTGEARFWDWYERLWAYSWQHMIDHRHGAWFRILRADNSAYSDEKSPAGKTDYHTMGACYELVAAFRAASRETGA